ncbi:hypothetical protein AAK882_02685 [Carnobacteriaceae bacterium 52-44]
MPRVWKSFDTSYFDKTDLNKLDIYDNEIENQCPHCEEEKSYLKPVSKVALLKIIKDSNLDTLGSHENTEILDKNKLYDLEGIAYLKGLENMIESYLSIRNSSPYELDITDYSKLDINQKVRLLESKKMTKIISNVDRKKLKEISTNNKSQARKINKYDLDSIKSIMTQILTEFVKEIL